MKEEKDYKKLIADDTKLIIATVTIVASILGSFYTVKNEVAILSERLQNTLTLIQRHQDQIESISRDDSSRDSRLATLEALQGIKH